MSGPSGGELTQELIDTPIWTDDLLVRAGIPIVGVPLISVGGGLGSFTLIDRLRVSGVPLESLRVLTALTTPWESFSYLARVSQIGPRARLRSDSSASPDNVWGFPSLALRESLEAGSFREFLGPLWRVFSEPLLSEPFTPRAGQIIAGLDRECRRIRYPEIVAQGQVRMVRKREEGGYLIVLTPPAGATPTRRVAFRTPFVHLALGPAGIRFLPDLQTYREAHRDNSRVVNAYEPHEHLYDQLRRRPGAVMVRGLGAPAMRVVQRLAEERDLHGLQTRILHVIPRSESGPPGRSDAAGFSYQHFDEPKAVWGGQLADRIRRAEDAPRAQQLAAYARPTAPARRRWRQRLADAKDSGWYTTVVGEVESLAPGADDQISARVRAGDSVLTVDAAFVVDGSGLESDIGEQRVLADLLDSSGAGRNALGRLDVEPTCEVRGTRSGAGRMYASGAATAGGYLAGVDTFAGLQIAAARIATDLAGQDFCPRLGPLRSIRGWSRWVRDTVI